MLPAVKNAALIVTLRIAAMIMHCMAGMGVKLVNEEAKHLRGTWNLA